jgi:hypothetical protein
MKRTLAAAVILILCAIFALPTRAYGATDTTQPVPTSSTPTTLAGSVKIDNGWAYTGAVITGSGLTQPRKLNAYQAAVFVQSWLGEAIFGKPQIIDPPKSLPVYKVAVTGTWGSPEKATLPVYYANQGAAVWISFPATIAPSGTTPTTTPPPTKWFVAPARVKQAFEGTAKLVSTAGTATPTTAPVAAPAAVSHSSSSSTGWIIVLIVVGVLVAGALMIPRVARGRSSKVHEAP